MSQVRTRKRPAPGTSPLAQTQQPSRSPNRTLDPASGWQPQDSSTKPYTDSSFYKAQPQNVYPPTSPVKSQKATNQLAKRAVNQPIVPIQNYTSAGGEPWQFNDASTQLQTGDAWSMSHDDLDQKAEAAKKEAQANRKQIPPFVQKLSSFLDESRNTDLIRWSESGDSFVVLDEDEFARNLIPELFKHSNYASFVRQLNMYGFHKKVGLSDNSMRASERKNKHPSEYSNPYFKRGRPNLLWLIQKPKAPGAKNTSKAGPKAKKEDYDEDVDETFGRDNSPFTGNMEQDDGLGMRGGRQNLLTMGGNNISPMPQQNQLSSVQEELAEIRANQHRISQMLTEVRREHKQLYGQAKAFHDLHEQHGSSINAILTFLATVYSKNLGKEDSGLGGMFPGAIPNDQQHSNVVDMGEVRDQRIDPNASKPYKRPPLLLKDSEKSPASANNYRPQRRPMSGNGEDSYQKLNLDNRYPYSPAIQELSDHASNRSSESPQVKPDDQTETQQIPKADIMSMLNNATSQNNNSFSPNAPMDFSEALSHLQHSGGSTPLTPGQRQNMLQLMGNEDPNINHGLIPPDPSDNPAGNQAYFDQTSTNLDQLDSIIRKQNSDINNLSTTLTPLSPSGSIPGINNDNTAYPETGTGNDFLDIDNIFNSNDYFNDASNGDLNFNSSDLPDFDFGGTDAGAGGALDGGSADFDFGAVAGDGGLGAEDPRVKEMGSSEGTSPANTVGTVGEEEGLAPSPGKRRRVG